jgi:hypothetical protein
MGRKCRLFARSTSSPGSQIGNLRAPIGKSLRATSANIPVLQRLSVETGFDHDCRPLAAVNLVLFSVESSHERGNLKLGLPGADRSERRAGDFALPLHPSTKRRFSRSMDG